MEAWLSPSSPALVEQVVAKVVENLVDRVVKQAEGPRLTATGKRLGRPPQAIAGSSSSSLEGYASHGGKRPTSVGNATFSKADRAFARTRRAVVAAGGSQQPVSASAAASVLCD